MDGFDKLHEECGVFGIFRREGEGVLAETYHALYALQHRGQESCGIAVNRDGVIACHKDVGLVTEVFTSDVLSKLQEGHMAVGHCRYGTTGTLNRENAQPMLINHRKGAMAVCHNGNLTNAFDLRDELEQQGAIFHTTSDTEVIAYMLDYLVRKQGLSWMEAANVVAAPFWSTIDQLPEEEKARMTLLRKRFPSMLITGPFSILVGFKGGMMALNDRLKLRSMVVAETEEVAYVASEECAIRRIAPQVEHVWAPRGGQPVIFTREGGEG